MSTCTEYSSLPPRLGTQFTPGAGEVSVDDTKDSIPFQDLSKLAKRMDWAVVKMTNVHISAVDADIDSMGLDDRRRRGVLREKCQDCLR